MTAQLGDLVEKLGKTEQSVQHRCGIGAMSPIIAAARAAKKNAATPGSAKETKEETALAKVVKDSFVPFSLLLESSLIILGAERKSPSNLLMR